METSYLIKLLKEISDIMAENKDKLIEMDGIVGDGDLGLTMSDGFKAAYDAVSDGAIADARKTVNLQSWKSNGRIKFLANQWDL